MKILLLRDVYKLGHAGDVRKVADGYARNFLLPRRFAVPAKPGALGIASRVREVGEKLRKQETKDKAGLAEQLEELRLTFPAKANDEGQLYGSITHQMICEAIEAACGEKIDRRSVLSPALRSTGEHQVRIRLASELSPSVTVVVHREDETPVTQDYGQEQAEERLSGDQENAAADELASEPAES